MSYRDVRFDCHTVTVEGSDFMVTLVSPWDYDDWTLESIQAEAENGGLTPDMFMVLEVFAPNLVAHLEREALHIHAVECDAYDPFNYKLDYIGG